MLWLGIWQTTKPKSQGLLTVSGRWLIYILTIRTADDTKWAVIGEYNACLTLGVSANVLNVQWIQSQQLNWTTNVLNMIRAKKNATTRVSSWRHTFCAGLKYAGLLSVESIVCLGGRGGGEVTSASSCSGRQAAAALMSAGSSLQAKNNSNSTLRLDVCVLIKIAHHEDWL